MKSEIRMTKRFGAACRPSFVVRGSLPLAIVCIGAAVIGCSTEKKQKWLTFFFDGVPTGTATYAPRVDYDENGKPLDKVVVVQTNQAAAPKPRFVAHPPYEDKSCTECHESRFSVKMKGPQTKVCFECHEDFLSKLKVKHQPAENGECSSCHDPHGNSNPKMLLQMGQNLCAQCHDSFPKTAKSIHQPVENGECLSCHNPHASSSKGLLVKPDGTLCFECHEDLQQNLTKAAFKHDPAGNAECASCHNPHQSNEKGLLIKARGKLCFECHEEKDMAAVKAHAGQLQKSCIDCHDPHLGADKFFLKPAAKSGGAQ